jgi:hypothetical protein
MTVADIERLVEAGDLATANRRASALAAADPSRPDVHNLLGYIAYSEERLEDAERAFELALALSRGTDADAAANLKAVRAALAARPKDDFSGTVQDLARGHFGSAVDPLLLGGLLAGPLGDDLSRRIDELPTAASAFERRFLLRYASRLWDGRGDVFENGPLLGSTTRALAIGMLLNPKRSPSAKLYTYDWFSTRVPLDVTPDVWSRLVRGGLLSQDDADSVASGSFLQVYRALHSGHDYSPLVRPAVGYLPGAPGDNPFGDQLFEPADREFSLVFVDGCKSWYGTRYFLERIADRFPVGGHLVMQDYGWFTCFWLPAIIGLLGEHFRLVAHTHDTYGFELLKPLTPELVRDAYPEHPADLGRAAIDDLFGRLLEETGRRGEVRGAMVLGIQHAAAIAYIGEKDEAKHRIQELGDRPEYAAFRKRFIEPALKSPTYTPDGPLVLN